jgi:RNA polymerase sigma-70 factor, ECF subfamily
MIAAAQDSDAGVPGNVTVASLVVAARNGDEAAFTRLHARYARAVHGVILAHSSPDEADDLVQETFLAAWKQLRALRDPSAFGGWLMAIARNEARRARRGALTLVTLDESLPAPAHEPAIDGARVLEAIRSLPDAYRETLLLRLVEGMSGPEIAELTGMTHGSVRVNLHRGMELLRARLGWTHE